MEKRVSSSAMFSLATVIIVSSVPFVWSVV
jgi:hypothetical protein